MQPLKIVHCGIFNESLDGGRFYSIERKISHGLHQNGHLVYDFSYRDIARSERIWGLKNLSIKKMNERLITLCNTLRPDILLLAKSEQIAPNTLKIIKSALPNIKIAQWYVDHLKEDKSFFEKLNLIDCFFYANALNLRDLSKKYSALFSFFPNICDEAFDRLEQMAKTTDVIYIASDYKEDARHAFAKLLNDFCLANQINLKIYASLNRPQISGADFTAAINSAKIAINFNRDDELDATRSHKLLGASDRMAQFMGCGACLFSPEIAGFDEFFRADKEAVYFKNPNECFEKIKYYLNDDRYISVATAGRNRAIKLSNAKRVTKFMLELVLNKELSEDYEWAKYIYKSGDGVYKKGAK